MKYEKEVRDIVKKFRLCESMKDEDALIGKIKAMPKCSFIAAELSVWADQNCTGFEREELTMLAGSIQR